MRIGTVNINFSGFFARIKLCFASGGRDSKGSGLPHDVYTMNVFANSGDDFGPYIRHVRNDGSLIWTQVYTSINKYYLLRISWTSYEDILIFTRIY